VDLLDFSGHSMDNQITTSAVDSTSVGAIGGNHPSSKSKTSAQNTQHESQTDFSLAENLGFELKRMRGPKPGTTTGHKRKPESQLSTHPHTKRQRERYKKLSPIQRAVANAKNADNMAIHRAYRSLKQRKDFQNASLEAQELLKVETRQNTLRDR
jgi:hypothetical protein